MMQTVQLSVADRVYAAAVREALSRSCACHVESVDRPDPGLAGVLVLDESGFARLPLPLSNPERVVLITRRDPRLLAQAWEAGIVSVCPKRTLSAPFCWPSWQRHCVLQNPTICLSRVEYPPVMLRLLRQYPHKIGLPDRNVAKSIG